MSGTGSHAGTGVGDAIKKGVGLVHGTGEAIRGNFNAAADSATGDHASAARNQNIAARGVDEMENGHYHGTGAGVTPHDTHQERMNRAAQGESAPLGSSNYGPHTTNVGNKFDPRFDSDTDHRGTAAGSTNFGPHGTNTANKLDPRIDSDGDRAYSWACYDRTCDGTQAPHVQYPNGTPHTGGKGDDSTNGGPRHTNMVNKLDLHVDSTRDHRAHPQHGTDPDSHCAISATNYGPHRTNVGHKLDPAVDSDLDHHGTAYSSHGASGYGPYNTNCANKLDPRIDSDLNHQGPGTHDGDIRTRAFENADCEMMHKSNSKQATSAAFDPLDSRSQHAGPTHQSNNARRPSHEDPPQTDNFDGPKRSDTMPHLHHNCPDGNDELGDDRYTHRQSKTQHAPHSSRVANVLDPRVDSAAPLAEPHSTQNPHQSGFLNLIDPRVERAAVKKLGPGESGLMNGRSVETID